MKGSKTTHREPTPTEAYVCIILVVLAIFLSLRSGMTIQIGIILATIIAFLMSKRLGFTWSEMEKMICERMGQVTPTILTLWSIGFLLGAMMYSGLIPMVVYYGFKIIDPRFLYVSAFLICCIMSTMTGSSWCAAGTAGVACMALSAGHGASDGIMAGAVIAGSLFGDKLSPMSETTNLAPVCAGTDLWSHIRAQVWTTIPTFCICLVFFFVLGLGLGGSEELPEAAVTIMTQLDDLFNWNIILILPVVLLLILAVMKMPIIPIMISCGLLCIVLGAVVQGFDISVGAAAAVSGFDSTEIAAAGYEIDSLVSNLLDRGGMTSMVTVVVICYCSFSMTTVLTKSKFLEVAIRPLMNNLNKRWKTMLTAEIAVFSMVLLTGTSYMGCVFVGEFWAEAFDKNKMGRQVLSRTLEDVGTCVLCVVPWANSGIFYMSTLGVSIFGSGGYFLYTVFPFACPLIALILAIVGWGMYPQGIAAEQDE